MKVIIAGSRGITRYEALCAILENIPLEITTVISGTAKGVDQLGERWAKDNDIELLKFPADWKTLGKKAGMLRNKQMAEQADALIAIWDGESKGTKNMLDIADELDLKTFLIVYQETGV